MEPRPKRHVFTPRSFSYRENPYYTNRKFPYPIRNPGIPSQYGYPGHRENRAIYRHPNYEPREYMEMSIVPLQQNFPYNYNRPKIFQKIEETEPLKEDSREFQKKTPCFKPKEKYPDEKILINEDQQPKQSDENQTKAEEHVLNSSPVYASKKSESYVLKYCLDRQTQHIISRLQNDFRLTTKYITFEMYEKPAIADFKPTPMSTTNKFHDRFKCLFIGQENLSIDLTSDLENTTEKQEVLENFTTEVRNEYFNSG